MKKKLLFILLFIFITINLSYSQTVYRIRLRSSSYSAQLRGITGTPTVGISINGSYSSKYLSHYFLVSVTGDYELYYDPLGGTSYIEDTDWDDGQDGKTIYADDIVEHIHGHGSGISGKIATPDIVVSGVSAGTYNYATITVGVDGRVTSAVSGICAETGAGGSDKQVQFNNGGNFDGNAEFSWDRINKTLGIGVAPSATKHVFIQNISLNIADDYYGLQSYHVKKDGATDEDNIFIGINNQMSIQDADKVHGNLWGIYSNSFLTLGTIGTVVKNKDLIGIEIDYGQSSGTIYGNLLGLKIDGSQAGTLTGRKYDLWIENNPPKIGMINDTQSDASGSRYSLLDWLGRQSGNEISVLARVGAFHSGSSDDQKGYLAVFTNSGSDNDTPVERLRIDETGLHTITGSLKTSTSNTALTKIDTVCTATGVIRWFKITAAGSVFWCPADTSIVK